jgi:hypothetical protein
MHCDPQELLHERPEHFAVRQPVQNLYNNIPQLVLSTVSPLRLGVLHQNARENPEVALEEVQVFRSVNDLQTVSHLCGQLIPILHRQFWLQKFPGMLIEVLDGNHFLLILLQFSTLQL